MKKEKKSCENQVAHSHRQAVRTRPEDIFRSFNHLSENKYKTMQVFSAAKIQSTLRSQMSL